ncbi:hypothetical protein MAWWA_89 [Bacillus phage vB_BspH_Mawwa]|nr:hypothetical protein MAWWA_89 [Bacillus phage vB_BspH_Mawwa]
MHICGVMCCLTDCDKNMDRFRDTGLNIKNKIKIGGVNNDRRH